MPLSRFPAADFPSSCSLRCAAFLRRLTLFKLSSPACRAVEVVCQEGPARVLELVAMGAEFTRNKDGSLHLTKEGGHNNRRIVHAAGEQRTGGGGAGFAGGAVCRQGSNGSGGLQQAGEQRQRLCAAGTRAHGGDPGERAFLRNLLGRTVGQNALCVCITS